MLVVDPKRRISIGQIKQHRWMESMQTREDLILRLHDVAISDLSQPHNADSYNEHILNVMQNARIDRKKTIEVGQPIEENCTSCSCKQIEHLYA